MLLQDAAYLGTSASAITDFAVFDVTADGSHRGELAPGVTIEQVTDANGRAVHVADDLVVAGA